MSEERPTECRYFKMGKCFRGDNCAFLHTISAEAEETSELVEFGFVIDRNGSEEPVIVKPLQQKNRHLKRVRDQQECAITVPASTDAICKYFMRGKCFRDSCKFRHDFASNEVISANSEASVQRKDDISFIDIICDPDPSETDASLKNTEYMKRDEDKESLTSTNLSMPPVDANSILMKYSTSKMTHYKRNPTNRR